MITTIIFSFNRAMQLELLLDSIKKYDTANQLELHILYATSSTDFEKGYDILKQKFTNCIWHKEKTFIKKFVCPLLPLLYWRNYYWWLKHKYNRYIQSNFNNEVQRIIAECNSKHIMFLTDDSVFVHPIELSPNLLNKVKKDGYSYSLRHGANIVGGNFIYCDNFIEWNRKARQNHSEWSYPFSVDGHIYNKKTIQRILKIVIFNNPNTLEGNVACYVNKSNYFRLLIANTQSCLLGFELNRVQTINENNNLNIDNNMLNDLYLKGYKLNINYKINDIHFFRPELIHVMAIKNDDKIVLYGQE